VWYVRNPWGLHRSFGRPLEKEYNMCTTCGCKQPKNKHGEKTLAAANKKFAKKTTTKKAGKK
jgi:hypothetical protein